MPIFMNEILEKILIILLKMFFNKMYFIYLILNILYGLIMAKNNDGFLCGVFSVAGSFL